MNARKTPFQKKPQIAVLTPAQAEAIVAKYAKMKDVTVAEARCLLIASGWRRLGALARYAKKGGGK